MNFPKFIDNRYQEVNWLLQTKQIRDPEIFPVANDAEVKALHQVLTWYRSFLKYLFVPKVFFDFAMMKIGLRSKPGTPLFDAIKAAEKKKAEKELEKKAQKVGMLEMVQNKQEESNQQNT